MTLKTWDYLQGHKEEKDEIFSAIEDVLESGQLILGENVRNFEHSFAHYCGVSHGIGVNSGTDALFLALKALGIGKGDEVITVSNTAIPTISAIVAVGATPRFIDINSQTYLMDTSQLEQAVSKSTKCIVPVHLFGQCVDMTAVNSAAKDYGLFVIEDCAQAHGAQFKCQKAGSMSDLAIFSFYPTKVLGGYGDGGMVVTNDQSYFEKVSRLRCYGTENNYFAQEHGYNSRLDELHAAILLTKLKWLDSYIERRRSIAEYYDLLLRDTELILPYATADCSHVYHQYVVRHPERNKLLSELKTKDIELSIHYPWPVHLMPAYQYLNYKIGDLPHTEQVANEIFSLPMFPTLGQEEQAIVGKYLKDIVTTLI